MVKSDWMNKGIAAQVYMYVVTDATWDDAKPVLCNDCTIATNCAPILPPEDLVIDYATFQFYIYHYS
jgi:hypothetical protein